MMLQRNPKHLFLLILRHTLGELLSAKHVEMYMRYSLARVLSAVVDYTVASLDTCRRSDILPGTNQEDRRTKEMVNLNFRWFMQTLLDRKDRMSMYQSLEVRVPFCDYRIAEYLYGVPWQYKDYQGREKGLLRQAMDGILPEAVAKRKKSPYPKTYDPAYAEAMRQRLLLLMDEKAAPVWQIVDRNALQQLINGESPWPWYGQLMGTPQTMAYMLQVDFWLREYSVCLI